jgi:hypothetical protein
LLKVFRTVGEAVGKALAVIASAVDDLPNVMGSDDVCKDSLGRLLGAGCGARASISVAESECSDVRLFVFPLTRCVDSAGAVGFIARASMSETKVFLYEIRSKQGACGVVAREDGFTVRLGRMARLTRQSSGEQATAEYIC